MFCIRCGSQNPEGAARCAACGEQLTGPVPGAPINSATMVRGPELGYNPPRTSGMAIASLVLGILGLFLSFLTALPGLILGIIALCQINRNRARLTGAGLAIAGIAVSAVLMLFVPIMAAILFPVFAQAREKARQASCENNLKQICTATMAYVQDYDEHLPPAAHWTTVTFPYIKSELVFRCPDDESGSRSSYASNSALSGLSLDKVAVPSMTVGTYEARSNWDVAGGPDLLAFRHRDTASVGFVDGHVKAVPHDGAASLTSWNPGAQAQQLALPTVGQ